MAGLAMSRGRICGIIVKKTIHADEGIRAPRGAALRSGCLNCLLPYKQTHLLLALLGVKTAPGRRSPESSAGNFGGRLKANPTKKRAAFIGSPL